MIIKANNIHKSFGELEVLKGIDFETERSSIVAITGASGAGKTTLLEILGTLSKPDKGELTINGKNLSSYKRSELTEFRGKNIGFIFQAHHLLPEFTALENVMIPSLIAGTGREEAKAKAQKLLAAVGLENRASHKSAELSGGECQRVAIARALINNPAVVFADEPSGNLDSVTKEEIHSLFFKLREQFGQTFVIVTHDTALASRCDKTYTMKDGLFV